ncbi:AEC family transporter [Actinoplanes sp. NPDC051851]|uniref:AEC family transporter n=1 Tax=Actinoplanes sp. NPDC051851 TaxID=3154753 RepID=UPI0034280F23
MISALSGIALIGAIVLVGWGVRRWAGLPDTAEAVLARLVYLVLNPCLLFTVVSDSDPAILFSEPLLVSAAAALLCFVIFASLVRRTRVIGALSAGYVNANYIGVPIATYVLGDAALAVPIMMLQLLIITPIALAMLSSSDGPRSSVLGALRNPMILGVLLGLVVALTGLHVPAMLMDPLITIGQAAVPLVLIAFGMSLSGRRVLAPGPDRCGTVVAVALKVAGMPAIAYALALLLHLPPAERYGVTVMAALPTAQNIYLYAQQADHGVTLARDAILLSTLLCAPALLVITLLG